MFNSLASLLPLAALSLAAFGAGRPLLRCIGVGESDRLTTTVFSLGIGFVAGGGAFLVLGLAGAIYPSVAAVLTMVGCCWGLAEIANLCLLSDERLPTGMASQPAEPDAPWPAPPRRLFGGVLAVAAVACTVSLLGALTPPTADAAFAGPLESAKRFVVEHRIVPLPASPRSTPLLADVWCCWAVALEGGVCAQLTFWGLGLLLASATVVLAQPLLGRRWAWIAGGLVLLTPAVSRPMSPSAETVALAALATLALAAWWQAAVHGGNDRWFVVAGAMAGGALGIHPAAALLALPLGVLWIHAILRRAEQRRFLIRGGIVAAIIALGVGGAFYGPLIADLDWSGRHGRANVAEASTIFDYLGIVVLAAAPGLLLTRRLRGLGAVVFAATLYTSLVVATGGDARLLLPAAPLLSVAAVWVWIETRRFPPAASRVAAAAFASMLLLATAESLAQLPDAILVPLGIEDRDDYLLRQEPSYRAAIVANRVLRPDARILSQEPRTFYFDRRVTWENADRRLLEIEHRPASAPEIMRHLREAGYTHLLLAEPAPDGQTDSPLPRLADAMLTLTDYRNRAADGAVRRYRLVTLR